MPKIICLLRDFGRSQNLSWFCACVAEPFLPRAKNVQRYSFQRGFVEKYTLFCDYKALFENANQFLPQRPIKSIPPLQKLERRISTPVCAPMQAGERTFCGRYTVNPDKATWNDRSIFQVGNNFEGYTYQVQWHPDTNKRFRIPLW